MEKGNTINQVKTSDLRIYGRLLSYVVPYLPLFLISILGFGIFAGSQVAFAEWLKRVIDYVDNPVELYPEKPLIRDLIIEGLSLARAEKEQFASVIDSNNGDVTKLFDTLKEFVAK